MRRPPTVAELVGGPEPVTGLDERQVIDHFLGKTQAEARRMYPHGGLHITEDFTYMASDGLRYYLQPAFDYLRDEESAHDWDFCRGLLGSLSCQARSSPALAADVLALMKEIATYCDSHREKFELDPQEELFDEYLR